MPGAKGPACSLCMSASCAAAPLAAVRAGLLLLLLVAAGAAVGHIAAGRTLARVLCIRYGFE